MAAWPRLLILLSALTMTAGHVAAPSCRQAVGAAAAQRMVARCLQVSPATHPPCNAENPCDLIIGEIRRGCALLGDGAPGFCRSDPPH